jgi:hypothetical protein
MIDWRYRFSTEPLENFYLELGLYRLNRESSASRWLETPLVPKLKGFISNPESAIGNLKVVQAATSDAPSAA